MGFVTFDNDFDGILRHVPLVMDAEGHLVKQLGFAVACDLLGIDVASIRLAGGRLTMTDADGGNLRRVPVDGDGRSLLNWHLDRRHRDWQHSFDHLPVSRVMELVFNRRAIEENRIRRAVRLGEAVELAAGGQEAVSARYEADVRRRDELRRQLGDGQKGDTSRTEALAELGRLERRIHEAEQQALEFLQVIWPIKLEESR